MARFHGLDNAVLRLGNVYGPRQSPHGEAGVVAIFSERLLPTTAGRCAYGHGTPTRDYVHVGDVARARSSRSQTPQQPGRSASAGAGRCPFSTCWTVSSRQRGRRSSRNSSRFGEGELTRSAIDSTAADRAFGWRPEIQLEDGLADTFRWYADTYEDSVDRRPLYPLSEVRGAQPESIGGDAAASAVRPRAFAPDLSHIAVGLAAAVDVGALGAADGGYFRAWGWTALVALWLVIAWLLLGRAALHGGRLAASSRRPDRARRWTWLSLLWTDNTTQTVLEGFRMLAYAGVAAALVLVVRRTTAANALGRRARGDRAPRWLWPRDTLVSGSAGCL